MAALEQELITFTVGPGPRTLHDPLIYIDVAARSLRMIVDGCIVPLEPINDAHRLMFKGAIDSIIDASHAADAKLRTRRKGSGIANQTQGGGSHG